jgi:cytochrome c-type biogenesis protein
VSSADLLQAFVLGNASILTNVCLLPLYPGLVAFLAGSAGEARARRAAPLLGLAVLAGVLAAMVLLGGVLYALGQGFSGVLPWLVPAAYLLAIGLGILMLLGRNPFAAVGTPAAPRLGNPFAAAFAYGAFLAPMTLPCTGPILITAIALGSTGDGSLAREILWFLAFGLGFGWPLVLLPLLAMPAQRRFTGWLATHHTTVARASGALLVVVGLWGLWVEVLPNLAFAG